MNRFVKTNYVVGLDLPEWLIDQFYYESGFIVKNQSIERLEKTDLPLVVFEIQLVDLYKNKTKWQKFKESIRDLDLEHLVIYSRDMYSWPTDLFEQLNSMAEQKNFHIISNCDTPTDYKNLSIHIRNEVEYGINDPVFESLAFELQRNRKSPSKDFLLASVLKNEFRRAVYDHLLENKLLDNSVVLVNGKTIDGETIEVTPQHSKLLDDILKATKDKHFINVLDNFEYGQIGLPVFTAYEQCFCEIVLETSHQGISDLSEKTYRPILFGIPIVFLGSEKMYNKLLADGYVIPGKTFYSKWYSTDSMQDKLYALESFCREIMNDADLRKEMISSAQHNFEVFWTKRHSRNRKQNLEIMHKCFGDDNLITQIYKSLNS